MVRGGNPLHAEDAAEYSTRRPTMSRRMLFCPSDLASISTGNVRASGVNHPMGSTKRLVIAPIPSFGRTGEPTSSCKTVLRLTDRA